MERRQNVNAGRQYKATHKEHFLSSWLRDCTEDKTEEMEIMNKEAKEEESKRGRMQLEGEKARVLVVCKCTFCDLPSSMSERFLEQG